MKIPTTLKHKPVIVAENYDSIDGRGAYHSDAKGLSLGLAQWNDRGKVDISAKVWRHTGEKWSRQSEELPMHRVLDLAILLCRTNLYFRDEAYRHPRYYDPEHPRIDRVGLQGDAMDIEVCTENPSGGGRRISVYRQPLYPGWKRAQLLYPAGEAGAHRRPGPAAAGDGILIPERGLF